MDKSNIIISIIIVICIAAGVAAYGITNSENPIFSNLNSLDSGSGDSGNGIGNNTTHHDSQVPAVREVELAQVPDQDQAQVPDQDQVLDQDLYPEVAVIIPHIPLITQVVQNNFRTSKEIANQHIEQSGWYAGTPTLSADRTVWYVPIYDQSGNTVDSMEINANTGVLIGKG